MTDHVELIPGVFVRKDDEDKQATLRRLFPRDHFPELWQKFPAKFGEQVTAHVP